MHKNNISMPSEEYCDKFYQNLANRLRRRGASKIDFEVEWFDKHKIVKVFGQVRIGGKVYDFTFKKGRLKLTPYVDYTRKILGTRRWLLVSLQYFFHKFIDKL